MVGCEDHRPVGDVLAVVGANPPEDRRRQHCQRPAELVDAVGRAGADALVEAGEMLGGRRQLDVGAHPVTGSTSAGRSISCSSLIATTAVPIAKNSITCEPQPWLPCWIRVPTIPSACSSSASACMRPIANSRASYSACV